VPRLRDLVREYIPRELWDKVPNGFDIVGSREGAVAIIEIPEELEDYKLTIANAVLKLGKHIRTVLRRIGPRSGPYRLYRYEVLIPGPTEVIHKENGYLMKLDPTKVYFSPRDQGDRLDIARMVRPGETVLYPFAGVGPYAFAILKAQPMVSKIIAIETNPIAYSYLVENIKLNKASKIEAILGDAGKIMSEYRGVADRVVMTLPLGAHEYLDQAMIAARSGGVIHFYHLGTEEDPFGEGIRIIKERCEALSLECIISSMRIVREYAPRIYKVRIDFRIA